MSKKMSEQDALVAILDAMDGLGAGQVRRLLRAAATFRDVEWITAAIPTYIPPVVIRERSWPLTIPQWGGNEYISKINCANQLLSAVNDQAAQLKG